MKTISKFLKIAILPLLALSLFACDDDDSTTDKKVPPVVSANLTIVENAIATPELTSLVAALKKADLVDTLNGNGPFTVFAPTNDAFAELLKSLDLTIETVPEETLKEILFTHVITPTKVLSKDLAEGQEVSAFNNEKLTIKLSPAVAVVDGNGTVAEVTTPDIVASNGVIHIINKVLTPKNEAPALKSIVETAIDNPELSSLVAALKQAKLVETLNGNGPFTVFAPTNTAFDKFLTGLGIDLKDVPEETLKAVLLTHVITPAKVLSTDLKEGQKVKAANTEELMVKLSPAPAIVDGNGTEAKISTADVLATNGVVHIIDTVISPKKK